LFGFFKKFWKCIEGTAAIEFALLAIPYFTLSLAVIEMAFMFTAASMLEGATSGAARLIRTGQVQQATTDASVQEQMFRDAVCQLAVVLVDCNEIDLEVVNITNFSDFSQFNAQFDADGNLVSRGFNAGDINDVIMIRTAYRYTLMTPFIGSLLGEGTTNTRTFVSTIVFQTEPYEFNDEDDNV